MARICVTIPTLLPSASAAKMYAFANNSLVAYITDVAWVAAALGFQNGVFVVVGPTCAVVALLAPSRIECAM